MFDTCMRLCSCSCCFPIEIDEEDEWAEDEFATSGDGSTPTAAIATSNTTAATAAPETSTEEKGGASSSPAGSKKGFFDAFFGGPLECLSLNRQAFDRLLGPLSRMLHRNLSSYEQDKQQVNPSPSPSPSPPLAKMKLRKIPFEDLEEKGTLGRGAFGHVVLVRDRKTNSTFALKTVDKALIVERGQQQHIMNERNVMSLIQNQFVVNLHQTYNRDQTLHFLMEPALGGELFTLLRSRTKFEESVARFYAASIVLAFEHLHSKNILYRDLKPENILLDDEGYIKLTDFGFAKVCSGRTHTLCGTPDYLAPEVVRGKPHGKGVDWYTLGVLIFEMLSSYPPYYSSDHLKTYKRIISGKMRFPHFFSCNAKDLIKNLTRTQATTRFGVIDGGVDTIKKHSWFSGFDWVALESRTMKAPVIPKIKNSLDLSNFESYPDHRKPLPKYVDDGSKWDQDF